MDIENVIQIIEIREVIKEAAAVVEVEIEEVAEVEVIAEIPARTIVRIIIRITVRVKVMVKVMVKITIINNRSILAKGIRMEAVIGTVETTIRTGGKVEEGEAEFKVDGIRVPVGIAINVAAIRAEADNTEDATLHIFLMIVKISRKEKVMILK